MLGVLRDSTRLTALATAALVLFTTVQAFAVFALIISGATLFLLVGAVLVVTAGSSTGDADTWWPPEGGVMTMLTSRVARVATVCAVRAWLVGVAVAGPLSARATGEEYLLTVTLFDPVDPFRGAYV